MGDKYDNFIGSGINTQNDIINIPNKNTTLHQLKPNIPINEAFYSIKTIVGPLHRNRRKSNNATGNNNINSNSIEKNKGISNMNNNNNNHDSNLLNQIQIYQDTPHALYHDNTHRNFNKNKNNINPVSMYQGGGGEGVLGKGTQFSTHTQIGKNQINCNAAFSYRKSDPYA